MDRLETYQRFTKEVNDVFKKSPEDEKNHGVNKIKGFCERVPRKTSVQEWVFPVEKEIPDGTIALFAHSIRPIRCIGVIMKNPTCTKCVPTKYRYTIEKMAKKSLTPPIKMSPLNVNHQQLISKKKGFWLFWSPSLQAKITLDNLPRNMNKIVSWYDKYVHGMEKDPSVEWDGREKEDKHVEQFLLDKYPTPSWTEHTLNFQNRHKNKRVKHQEEEESESEDDLPPPPPPPYPPPLKVMPPFNLNDLPETATLEEKRDFLFLEEEEILNLFNIESLVGNHKSPLCNPETNPIDH